MVTASYNEHRDKMRDELKSILDRYSLCTLTLEGAEKELRGLLGESSPLASIGEFTPSKDSIAVLTLARPLAAQQMDHLRRQWASVHQGYDAIVLSNGMEVTTDPTRGYVDVAAELMCDLCKATDDERHIRMVKVVRDAIPNDATVHRAVMIDEHTMRIYLNGAENRRYCPQFQQTSATTSPDATVTLMKIPKPGDPFPETQ
jgi:hypothetical protein